MYGISRVVGFHTYIDEQGFLRSERSRTMSRCKKVQVAKVSMPYGNYKVLTERHIFYEIYRTWYDAEYKKHTNKVAECGSMAEALSTILDTDRAEMLKQADRERWYLIG